MKIKHVYQHDDTGCGIACVAMLVNQSYHELKKQLIQKGFFFGRTDFGTTFRELTNIITSFNFRPTPKRKFRKWANIPAKVAISSTNYNTTGGWHWVVFVRDLNGYFIYDPGKPRKKIRDLRGKMSGWFIEIC